MLVTNLTSPTSGFTSRGGVNWRCKACTTTTERLCGSGRVQLSALLPAAARGSEQEQARASLEWSGQVAGGQPTFPAARALPFTPA